MKWKKKKNQNRIKCRHFAPRYQVHSKYNTIGMLKIKRSDDALEERKIAAHAITKKYRIIQETIFKRFSNR